MKIARPNYDKPHRCPGWSGVGWLSNKHNWCDGAKRSFPRGYNYAWYAFNRSACCNTLILPLAVKWFDWRTWKWEFTKLKWKIRDWRADR